MKGRDDIDKNSVKEYIQRIKTMGRLINRLTTYDYATYDFVCWIIEGKIEEELEASKEVILLDSSEIMAIEKKFVDLCNESGIDEKFQKTGVDKKEFQVKFSEFRTGLHHLFANVEEVYQLVRNDDYVHFLLKFNNFGLILGIIPEVHLD